MSSARKHQIAGAHEGEIPQDSEAVGKSENNAINFENRPGKLKKPSENTRIPSRSWLRISSARPKPERAVDHGPDIASQPQNEQTSQSMNSLAGGSAQIQLTSRIAIVRNVSSSPSSKAFNTPSSTCSYFESQIEKGVTECASKEACNFELYSSTATLQPKIKFEPTIKASKRPSGFMDLCRSKRTSLAKKSFMETPLRSGLAQISNQCVEQALNFANFKSKPSRP
ncbi:hypothetical protein sscle_14g101080 [Sclerotinia sclerotiorum 1980 UF-70]|uniref:Uncharacterized protein n=1 Tax=Sclerotinia sclerotiorum (strain ATCC 18683 / 1980 / Ss-1) TaxID=665079 RepID=A0A1D9QK81_SCLS1|nr:hypothetical protein sscle_14g101080 [Sclerotinia sclerotiorum 1980 UF-70]